jgi:dihydroflavonol-4-reductase
MLLGDVIVTLITGASGFLGSAIAKVFREAGHKVRALVRASSRRTNINPLDTVVVGDIRNRDAMAAAVKGARYIVHAAADYRLWARAPAEIINTTAHANRLHRCVLAVPVDPDGACAGLDSVEPLRRGAARSLD